MANDGYGIDWEELQKVGAKAAYYLRNQRAQKKLLEQKELYNKAIDSVSEGNKYWQAPQKQLQGASQVRTANLAANKVDKALMNPSFSVNEALQAQSFVGADVAKNLSGPASLKVTPDIFTSAPQFGATQAAQGQALGQSFVNPQNVAELGIQDPSQIASITGGTGSGAGAAGSAGMGALGWGALAMQAIAALNIGAKKGKPAIGSGANKTVALGTGVIDEEIYGA